MRNDVEVTEVNPIAMVAIVTTDPTNGGYSISVEYGGQPIGILVDQFETLPASVSVAVTSTTVPSGYSLGATGAGSWTSVSASWITGVFTLVDRELQTFDFTVVLNAGVETVAHTDPRLIIKKLLSS
ncbi:MAG: hypothetical protein R3B09_30485 [Nannocystaceae bacterium]